MPQSDPLLPDIHSRSHRKQEMLELQKLGEALVKLTASQLASFDLPESLHRAILEAKSITSHEAKRRQLQYIGKIMREIDVDAIKHTLKTLQTTRKKSTDEFHHVEAWRDRLIAEGDDALNAFLAEHADVDRQALRQLIRNAKRDVKLQKNTGAGKALFQYLAKVLES